MYKIIQKLNDKFGFARWIVNDAGELGIRVFGVNMWYYKWPEPLIDRFGTDETGAWVYAGKREFGEVVKSIRMEH